MLLERKREQLLSSLQRRITREEDEAELDLSSLDKVSGKGEVGCSRTDKGKGPLLFRLRLVSSSSFSCPKHRGFAGEGGAERTPLLSRLRRRENN